MINEDDRCGPADDWGAALVRYWLAKRSGERAIRDARERTAQDSRQVRRGPGIPEAVEWVPCVRNRRLHAVPASRLRARFSGQVPYLPAMCRHRVIVVAVYWGGLEACRKCLKRCTVEPVEPARGTHVIRELQARYGRPPRPSYPIRDRQPSTRALEPATCQWLPGVDGQRHAVWDDTVMTWAFGKGHEPLVAVCGQEIEPHPDGPDGPAPVCWGCRHEERETDG